MPPVNADPACYRDEGYCVFRQLLPAADVEDYRASLARMIMAAERGKRMETLVEPHIRADDWDAWLELCRHRDLLAAASSLLGTDELLLLSSHLLVKQPRDGLAVEWHQDNTYWPAVDGTNVCTAWIALDAADLDNSCMKVIPRSHDGCQELDMIPTDGKDLLGIRVDVTPEMEASAVPLELAAGDVSFHDSFIIHGSDANHSSRRRAGLTLRYADALKVDVDVEKHRKPVYYVSGRGAGCRDGYRDISAGKALPGDPGVHRSKRFDERFHSD